MLIWWAHGYFLIRHSPIPASMSTPSSYGQDLLRNVWFVLQLRASHGHTFMLSMPCVLATCSCMHHTRSQARQPGDCIWIGWFCAETNYGGDIWARSRCPSGLFADWCGHNIEANCHWTCDECRAWISRSCGIARILWWWCCNGLEKTWTCPDEIRVCWFNRNSWVGTTVWWPWDAFWGTCVQRLRRACTGCQVVQIRLLKCLDCMCRCACILCNSVLWKTSFENIQLYLCCCFDPRMVPLRTMKFITLPLKMMGPITKALQNPGSKRNHVTCCPGVWESRMKKLNEKHNFAIKHPILIIYFDSFFKQRNFSKWGNLDGPKINLSVLKAP